MKYIIILIILLSISTAQAGYVNSFSVDQGFPDEFTAGSVYELKYSFSSYDTTLTVNFTVENNYLLTDEWIFNMYLDGVEVNCTENGPGNFTTTFDVDAGNHNFIVEMKTLPNIMPGIYNITFEFPYTEVITEEEDHSNAHRLWREKWSTTATTDPTETPTEAPTEFVEEIIEEPELTPEEKLIKIFWDLVIIALLIFLICMSYIIYKMRT